MTATEQFNFAHVISKGMSKQAVRLIGGGNPVVEDFVSAREALKKMLLAGGVGVGAGAAGAMALNHKSASERTTVNPNTAGWMSFVAPFAPFAHGLIGGHSVREGLREQGGAVAGGLGGMAVGGLPGMALTLSEKTRLPGMWLGGAGALAGGLYGQYKGTRMAAEGGNEIVNRSRGLFSKSANVKQANPIIEGLGKGLGFLGGGGARVGAGAVNAGVELANKAVQFGGKALRTGWNAATHPMHLPNNGLGKGLRQGWDAAWNLGNKAELPGNVGAEAGATARAASPIPEAVRSNPNYVRPTPDYSNPLSRPPITDPRRLLNAPPEPEHFSPLLPATTNPNRAVGPADYIPNYTHRPGSAGSPIVDVESSVRPSDSGNYRNMVADKWNGLKPWQRNTAIAGGAAAATANTASVYGNNSAADWQQEHPLMGWLGKTFGGMPDYQRKSYMLPSFLQH